MTIEEAIDILAAGDWWNYLDAFCAIKEKARKELCDALDTAIAALRAQQEAEKNDPLTLDELREMQWEPVFVTHSKHGKGWCIIDWHGVNKTWAYFSKTGTAEGMTAVPITAATYGETWLAYRHKPKEGMK